MKDVVMVRGYQQCEIDFVADNPGLTLFRCHQQLHMDYGFMNLLDYSFMAGFLAQGCGRASCYLSTY